MTQGISDGPFVTIALDRSAPQTGSEALPPDLLDCLPDVALATVAAMFSSPYSADGSAQTNENVLAVRLLALFAADAAICFHKRDFRDLDRRAAEFIRLCDDVDLKECAAFVRRQACERAARSGITAANGERPAGLVLVEPLNGRGFGPLDEGLAAEFHRSCKECGPETRVRHARRRLITYAALLSAALPSRCNRACEALVVLALYGAGARVRVQDKRTFRALERAAKSYFLMFRAPTGERGNGALETLNAQLEVLDGAYRDALPHVMQELANRYAPASESELIAAAAEACEAALVQRSQNYSAGPTWAATNARIAGFCLHRAQQRARASGLIAGSGN